MSNPWSTETKNQKTLEQRNEDKREEQIDEVTQGCPWNDYQENTCLVTSELCDLDSCAPYYFLKLHLKSRHG